MANRKIQTRVVSLLCIVVIIFANHPTNAFAEKHTHSTTHSTTHLNTHLNTHVNKPLDFKENKESAQKWVEKTYRPWIRDLSSSEIQVMNDYSGTNYRCVDDYLKYNKGRLGINQNLDEKIKLIDGALKKVATPQKIIVYKKMGVQAFGDEFAALRVQNMIQIEEAKKLAEKIINATKEEHSYMDASLICDDVPQHTPSHVLPILLQITVPKGTHAGYIGSIHRKQAEVSLLISREYTLQFHSFSIINKKGREILKIKATLKK